MDDLLTSLIGTSIAAVPPETAARLTQLGAELQRLGDRVLLGSKATILQSMGPSQAYCWI